MDQPTVADLEYQGKKRKIRREVFLERMNGLIPWQLLEACLRPFYPKEGRGDSPLLAVYHFASPLRPALLQSQRPRHG